MSTEAPLGGGKPVRLPSALNSADILLSAPLGTSHGESHRGCQRQQPCSSFTSKCQPKERRCQCQRSAYARAVLLLQTPWVAKTRMPDPEPVENCSLGSSPGSNRLGRVSSGSVICSP